MALFDTDYSPVVCRIVVESLAEFGSMSDEIGRKRASACRE